MNRIDHLNFQAVYGTNEGQKYFHGLYTPNQDTF